MLTNLPECSLTSGNTNFWVQHSETVSANWNCNGQFGCNVNYLVFCMQVLEIHPFQPSISLQFCSYCNASPWCIFRRPGTTTTHKYQWYAMNSLAARWSILWILFSGTRSWSLSTPISPKPLYPPTRNHHSTRWETRGYHLTQTSLVCGRLFLLQGVIYAHARHFLYIRLH